MAEFFSMGGYGFYIWTAYGVTALVMAALVVASLRALKQRETQLKVLQEAMPGGRRRRQARGEESS